MAERYGIWIPPYTMLKVVYRKAMNAWLVHSFMLKTRDLPDKYSGDYIFYRWIFRQVATHSYLF